MNRSIISGYEYITYYLHFAENPIRFGQVYAEIWIFIKYITRPFPPSFDKMQIHNAQEPIHASFKWYKKEVTGLFLPTASVVQYFIFFSMINWFSSFLFSFVLLHVNVNKAKYWVQTVCPDRRLIMYILLKIHEQDKF